MAEELKVATISENISVDEELVLQPIVNRKKSASAAATHKSAAERTKRKTRSAEYRRNPHASLYGVDYTATRWLAASESQLEAGARSNRISNENQRSQAYATIKVIQKLYRWFAYLALAFGAILLLFRCVGVLRSSSEFSSSQLMALFDYSFVVIFLEFMIPATFLAIAELMQIMVNIHSDFSASSTSDDLDL